MMSRVIVILVVHHASLARALTERVARPAAPAGGGTLGLGLDWLGTSNE